VVFLTKGNDAQNGTLKFIIITLQFFLASPYIIVKHNFFPKLHVFISALIKIVLL